MSEPTTKTRKCRVEVIETLSRVVTVDVPDTTDAENIAISIVSKMYRNEEIVLDSEDYAGTEFKIYNDNL